MATSPPLIINTPLAGLTRQAITFRLDRNGSGRVVSLSVQDDDIQYLPNIYGFTSINGAPNGNGRQASQGTHSNPAQGAGGSSGAQSGPGAAAQQALSTLGSAIGLGSALQAAQANWHSNAIQFMIAQQLAAAQQVLAQQHLAKAAQKSLPKVLTMGEILAWRCWEIKGFRLKSYSMTTIWEPGATMNGDPENPAQGIHAYKERTIARQECGAKYIFGQVHLWGRVIEHELGYRSEFAKIVGLEHGDLAKIYGVELLVAPEPTLEHLPIRAPILTQLMINSNIWSNCKTCGSLAAYDVATDQIRCFNTDCPNH